MTSLVKYDAACRALAEAKSVDEVKDLRDKAEAMRIYGMQARNKTLEVDAAEIRIRAERRLGELIAAQKADGGLNTGAAGVGTSAVVRDDRTPTLADAGISKDLSSRAQKIAAVPAEVFEAEVGEWRERVTAENARVTTRLEKAGERATKKAKPAPEPTPRDELEDLVDALTEDNKRLRDENDTLRRAADPEAVKGVAQLKGYIKTLESQRDDWMNQSAELKKMVKRLQRQIGEVNA